MYLYTVIMTALEIENIELKRENEGLKQTIQSLRRELANMKKVIFGAKRERFTPTPDGYQGTLFEGIEEETKENDQATEEVVEVIVRKKKKRARKKPQRNTFPEHLPREETIIEPEGIDEEKMVKIGEDITETLAYVPAKFYVKKIIRPRYALKDQEDQGVKQAPVPPRLIPRGMADESLIAYLVVEKILFHTPIYRFNKKLKQAGIRCVKENNLRNWFNTAGHSLRPLCELLKEEILSSGYVQADESTIKVLVKDKPGSAHRGYMWLLHQPQTKLTSFNYHPSRGIEAAKELIAGYKNILQTDGYKVYEKLARELKFLLIFCMAHARRKFFEARDTDPPTAEYFLSRVQKLYEIERRARDEGMNEEQRMALRKSEAVPILEELHVWLKDLILQQKHLPNSPMGKAIAYSYKRWEGLSAYAQTGNIEIDNNLIENKVRPLALGRKNYLFAGSHEYAVNLACLYSIVGTANNHGLNVQRYMTWLFRKVATSKINKEAISWLPHKMPQELLSTFIDQ